MEFARRIPYPVRMAAWFALCAVVVHYVTSAPWAEEFRIAALVWVVFMIAWLYRLRMPAPNPPEDTTESRAPGRTPKRRGPRVR